MDLTKPNDIFVTSTLDPNVNVNDLLVSGISPDNTSFFDEDSYKNNDFVKKAFTDDKGNFDDVKFNAAYNNAANLYSELSNDKFLKDNLTYDAYDFMRPLDTKTKQEVVQISTDINPYKSLYGRTGLHSIDEGNLSIRELAQQNKIFDTETGKFLDKSANDLGLFGSIFNKTLVYAQWDDDGTNIDPFSGREVKHQKGEYKLNPEGNFYIETLGDRDVAGKQVVNPTDLITTDGSYFNKIDFFDSDGKDKSIIGTTFKTAAEIAPYLIPGFNMYYGTFKMSMGLAEALPSLYKSLEGIILGDTDKGNETALWKAASSVQGALAKYSTESQSDKGMNSMWNYEQLAKMVSGTFSLIYELRAASNLSNLFYKVNDPVYAEKLGNLAGVEIARAVGAGTIPAAEEGVISKVGQAAMTKAQELSMIGMKQSGMAKALSLGYMSLTSTADVYNQAIEGGYDKRTAGIAALLAAGGQYALLTKNRMASWFLDDMVGFDREANRAAMRKAILPELENIQNSVELMDVNKVAGKKSLANTITKIKKGIDNIFVNPISSNEVSERVAKNAIVWGVEGVTLQMATDAAKGVVDTMSWLGLTGKKGSFNTAQNVFSAKGLEGYISNFLGGLVGGGLFELHRLKIEPFLDSRVVSPQTDYSLLRMISNGKAEELKREVDSMTKYIGNDILSPLGTDSNGKKVYVSDPQFTQADLIAGVTKRYIDYLDNLLNSENLKIDDNSLIKKTVLDEIRIHDLENTGTDKFILSDFNELVKDIVDHKTELSQIEDETSDGAKELKNKITQKKQVIQDMLDGKKANYYKELSLFSLNKDLHSPFISLNVIDYAKEKYGVDFNALPENTGTLTKEKLQKEFDEVVNSEDSKKEKMKMMFSVFKNNIERYSNDIGEYADEKHLKSREKFMSVLTQANLLSPEELINNSKLLNEFGLPKYNLSDILGTPLGEYLLKGNFIDTTDLSKDQIDNMVNELNQISIPSSELNLQLVDSAIKTLKQAKLEQINNHVLTEANSTGVPVEEVQKKYQDQIDAIEKETPKLKNPTGREILPLDLMYLNNELKNEPYITSEVSDFLTKKLKKYLEDIKDPLKRVYLDKEDILASYPEEEGFDLSPFNLDEIISKINIYKKNILDSNSPKEVAKNIDGFKKYAEKFNNTILEDIMTNLVSDLKPVDNVLLETEGLLKKDVLDNKLYDLLNKVNITTFAGNISKDANIMTILRDELKVLESIESPEDYVRSRDIINSMQQALESIKLVKAINTAMLNTGIDATNPYGFNVSIREGLLKEGKDGEAEKYKVISPESYMLLKRELTRLENRFQFLIDLANNNNASVATIQEDIRNNNTKLLLNTLTDASNSLSPINLSYNDTKLLDIDKLNEIMQSDKSNDEKLINIEENINYNFNTLVSNHGLDVLTKVFEPFNNPDFKEEIIHYNDPGFTKSNEVIHTLDYFNYLHMLFSLNSKDFYNNYKKLLEKELTLPSEKKGPFFGQEFSIRFIEAYRNNKEIMSHSQKFIKNLLGEKRLFLENSLIVTGSGGVGKTTVVSNFAIRMDKSKNTEFIASAPNNEILDKLKNDISRGENLNVSSVAKEQLFKNILGDNYDSFYTALESLNSLAGEPKNNLTIKDSEGNNILDIGNFNNREINLHSDFENKLKNPFKEDGDTVIYIDEVSWMNPLELKILDSLAGQSGSRLYLVGLGDDLQQGATLNKITPFSLESFYFLHPPKLKGVIRAQNIHKKDNIEIMEVALKNRLNDIVFNTTIAKDNKISLGYFNTNRLEGDYFTPNLSIDDLLKLDKTKEIAIITEGNDLAEEYKSLFANAGFDISTLNIIPKDKIQGREFDQVVSLYKIEYDPKNENSLFNAAKSLNTLIGRGRISTTVEGNNDLLSDLNIDNVQKPITSKVDVEQAKIEDLLTKRVDNLSNILKDFVPTEEEKPLEVNKMEYEASVNNQTLFTVDNAKFEPSTQELVTKTNEKDGDGLFTLYSFYNILNATISKVDGKLNIKEKEGNILSDMQLFEYALPETIKSSLSSQEAVNQFIIARNHILHGIDIPNTNIFSKILKDFDTSNIFVRKIVNSEFTEPYGKQAHMLNADGSERKNKTGNVSYFLSAKAQVKDVDGNLNEAYVTLGALPDINNATFRQSQPKNYESLKEIYDSMENLNELKVEGDLTPLTGIRIVYSDGTSNKPANNTISITGNTVTEFRKTLMEKFPGIMTTDLNTIKVFDDNEVNINNTFKNVGYNLGTPKKDLENSKALRFRPYIKVSYIDPNDNSVSKVMVLNAKSRDLSRAKIEYEETKNKFKETNKNNKEAVNKILQEDFPVLINRFAGLKLFNDVIKHFQGTMEMDSKNNMRDKADIIIDKVLNVELSSVEKAEGFDVFKTFSDMLDILKKSNYDLKNISNEDLKFLLGKIPGQTRLGNFGLRLLDILSLEDIKSLGDRTIYYNPIWKSAHNQAGEILMDGKFIKYFKLDAFLESPIFKINLTKSEVPFQSEPTEPTPAEVIESNVNTNTLGDIKLATKFTTPFIINNVKTEVPIDFKNWSDSEALHIGISSVYNATSKISSKLNMIDNPEMLKEIQSYLLPSVTDVLNNPSLIDNAKNLNATTANNIFDNISRKVSDALIDYIDTKGIDLSDLFLNSTNLIKSSNIDKQLNAVICK